MEDRSNLSQVVRINYSTDYFLSTMTSSLNKTEAPYLEMTDGVERHKQMTYVFAIANCYIFILLLYYELGPIKKPPNGKILRVYCILAAACTVLHSASEQVIFYLSWKNDIWCSISMCFKSTSYNLVTTFTYLFLWSRQRMFYLNPALKHLVSERMKRANWVAFSLILINPVAFICFQFIVKLYSAVPVKGCIVLRVPILNQLPFVAIVTSYTFIQVSLLWFYFFPLYTHNKQLTNRDQQPNKHSSAMSCNSMPISPSYVRKLNKNDWNNAKNKKSKATKEHSRNDTLEIKHNSPEIKTFLRTQSNASASQHHRTSTKTLQKLRRSLVMGALCVCSDISSATIISVFLLVVTPSSVINIPFLTHDISMLINVICIVCCFSDWSKMLFPFLLCVKDRTIFSNVCDKLCPKKT